MTPILTRTLRLIDEQHIPGLSLIVQRGAQDTLVELYHGMANLEHKVPVTADTLFEIASVTKLFTAQAVLKLAQDGRIRLDNPISHYLDQLPAAWQPVTIRHCLAHQSGLPSYTDPDAYWSQTRRDKTHVEVLDLVREKPLMFAPGGRYHYDNTGFYLLGLLIETVSGESYADYVARVIFKPLGMTGTQANDYARIIPNRADGYKFRDGALYNKQFYSTSNTFSAGILLSNPRDLLRWRRSLFNDQILNADYRRVWWTPHPSHAGNERGLGFSVGLGWFLVDSPAGTFAGHNGGIEGFAASFMYLFDHDLTVIALCSAGHVNEPHRLCFAALHDLAFI
jgi:CubicO group peptidase (beta-lactamase class C family)